MAKIVSIAAQKGGCGKSSLTIILASVLAYTRRKKVLVLDCDTRQKSIVTARDIDKDSIELKSTGGVDDNGEELCEVRNYNLYKEATRLHKEINGPLKDTGKKQYPYPIKGLPLSADDILNTLQEEDDNYDYILLDLPGTIENNDYFLIVQNLDVLFIPLMVDPLIFNSNFAFAKVIHNSILVDESFPLNKMFYFWSKYDPKSRKAQYAEFDDLVKKELPYMKPMEQKVLETNTMLNQKMRSTLAAPFGGFEEYGNILACINEMIDCIDK